MSSLELSSLIMCENQIAFVFLLLKLDINLETNDDVHRYVE